MGVHKIEQFPDRPLVEVDIRVDQQVIVDTFVDTPSHRDIIGCAEAQIFAWINISGECVVVLSQSIRRRVVYKKELMDLALFQ